MPAANKANEPVLLLDEGFEDDLLDEDVRTMFNWNRRVIGGADDQADRN